MKLADIKKIKPGDKVTISYRDETWFEVVENKCPYLMLRENRCCVPWKCDGLVVKRYRKGSHLHIPEWLDAIMGKREREIINHPTAYTSNHDSDYPDNRLPVGQQHIKSDIGRFTISGRKRQIIG